MDVTVSLNKRAKNRLVDNVDLKSKILDVGPLNSPIFNKNEANVYYADVKSTEEVKMRYSSLDKSKFNQIVDIDFVIEGSYENTFKNNDIKFDYVIFSHVFEHIPNPIDVLLDVSTILSFEGKICILLPDKEFTFDHYRENTSFADWYDVYIRGEEHTLPKLLLDNMVGVNNLNNPIEYWNNNVTEYPNSIFEHCFNRYQNCITDIDKVNYDGHRWVFTDRSFLKILENLYKGNLIPYNLISFFPTAYNDNTFGLILELDYSIQESLIARKKIIHDIHRISENIYKKRFEIEAKELINENAKLRDKLNKLININFKNLNHKQKEEYILIYYSGKFDVDYYTNNYGLNDDMDPIVHFLKVGANEGLNPSPNFDTNFYLTSNDDVKKSGMNPFVHYLLYGKKENRFPKVLTKSEIEELNLSEDNIFNYLTIKYSNEFDEEYYIKGYRLDTHINAIAHYLNYGANEGLNPSPNFDTNFYLTSNDDVKKSGMNPFVHYLLYGKKENRLPNNSSS